jgi:hypothetical protein
MSELVHQEFDALGLDSCIERDRSMRNVGVVKVKDEGNVFAFDAFRVSET